MTTRLYISNLANLTSKQDLGNLFCDFSKAVFVKLIRYKTTHIPSGSAFIALFNYEDACNAIEALHGTSLLGQTIKIVLAKVRRKPQFSIQYWN